MRWTHWNWIVILTFIKPIVTQSATQHQSNSKNDRQNGLNSGQSQNQPLPYRTSSRSTHSPNLENLEMQKNIFIIGNESRPVLFNSTSINFNDSSDLSSLFPVRRNPNGKLEVGDLSKWQPLATRPPTHDRKRQTAPAANSDFLFPDMPRCKDSNKSYCLNVIDYPTKEIENALKTTTANFDSFFMTENIPELTNITNITQRFGPGEETLCDSIERIIKPKIGKTSEGKELPIVNDVLDKHQLVRIEECQSAGERCKMTESFPNGYVTECKQKYSLKQMIAYVNSSVLPQIFSFPSCCQCVIKQEH